ncbi:MAG: hypothetical protein JO307_01910 [Bryobacterales bacterium]|nr:hypothetical protein [Bryobacterales bacterium]MBV9399724.1 hypothetical protein [Bryobacterales bacterium]
MEDEKRPEELREGWNRALPERLASPTYWPAMLALGMTIMLLGPVTNMAVTIVGGVFSAIALIGWIGDLLR